MPQYDYPSPDTIASSDCGNGPSPDSSFEHLRKEVEDKVLHSSSGVAVSGVEEAAEDIEAVDAQVQRAVGIARARCEGRFEQDGWIELDVTPFQYRHFCKVERENINNVRHDYDPYRCALAFRMPTATHDNFGNELTRKVTDWLALLRADPRHPRRIKTILSRIQSSGTSDLYSQVPSHLVPCKSATATITARHSPDGQFTYTDCKYPFFVLEVGYSHKSKGTKAKNLPGLAKYYYEDAGVKTVLTVDIEYTPKAQRREARRQRQTRARTARNTKQAAFSLYRKEKCVIANQVFRDESGGLVDSEGLTLYISDIVADSDSHGLDRPEFSLRITAQDMFDIIGASEVLQANREKSPSLPPTAASEPPRKRKIAWVLPEESSGNEGGSSEGDSQDEDNTQASASASTSASTSKRRRLSDAGFSSRSRPTTAKLGVRTRSQTRLPAGAAAVRTRSQSRGA
ncbi:hypothetical protein F5883DRAFT_587505 [Diaporthe sp. PMI_573]|nr:hypothetical protein F5883DRAFT_587505 [Diaporthaceae sp. PMI_573]